jgi:hypothetical protein
MNAYANPIALPQLAQGLSAVAARLEPQQAAAACAQAAAALIQAMSNANPREVVLLAQGLLAVRAGTDFSGQRQRAGALVAALGVPANGQSPLSALPLLYPAAEPLPCPLSTPQLVELLKGPLCIGEARRMVHAALGARYQRQFANHGSSSTSSRNRTSAST